MGKSITKSMALDLDSKVQKKIEKAQAALNESCNITSVSEYSFICNHYNKAVAFKKEAVFKIYSKEFEEAHELLISTELEILAFYMNLDDILDRKRGN